MKENFLTFIFFMMLGLSTFAQEGDSLKNVSYVLNLVEKMPFVEEGGDSWNEWMDSNNKYFESASKEVKNNKSFIQFDITEIGNVENVICIKGLGEPYDTEAIRLVQDNPFGWIAGQHRGKEVSVRLVVPVYFNDMKTK